MALTTTTDSSSQTTTGSPQTASEASGVASTQSGGVQPGTAASLLNGGSTGIQLGGAQLSTVSLNPATTGATASAAVMAATKPVQKHHINAPFLGVSALLIVVAVVLFFVTRHSVKTTT